MIITDNIRYFYDNYKKRLLLILLSFSMYFFYTIYYIGEYKGFYFDADDYWRISYLFYENGTFKPHNYGIPLRGYTFPMILSFLRLLNELSISIKDDQILNILFSSLYTSLLSSYFLPSLIEKLFETKIDIKKILSFNIIFLIFWGKYLLFPLTDVIVCLFVVISLFFSLSNRLIFVLLSGVSAGIFFNIRPVYMFSLLLFLGYIYVYHRKKIKSILIGFIIILIPQTAYNYYGMNIMSPLVQTNTSLYKDGLYMFQLTHGLRYQRYETNIDTISYPSYGVFFKSPYYNDFKDTEINSIKDYIQVAMSKPIPFIVSNTLHIFNGMDLWYNTPYLNDVKDRFQILSILNYTIIFLFCIISYHILKKHRSAFSIHHGLLLCIWLSPVVLAVPTCIEPRFFIGFHILMYTVICYYPILEVMKPMFRKPWFYVSYMIFITGCYITSSYCFSFLNQ